MTMRLLIIHFVFLIWQNFLFFSIPVYFFPVCLSRSHAPILPPNQITLLLLFLIWKFYFVWNRERNKKNEIDWINRKERKIPLDENDSRECHRWTLWWVLAWFRLFNLLPSTFLSSLRVDVVHLSSHTHTHLCSSSSCPLEEEEKSSKNMN